MRKLTLIFTIFLLAVLTACSSNAAVEYPEVTVDEDEKVSDETTVLSINGKEVNGKTYNDVYLQVKTIDERKEEKPKMSKEDLKDRALETIVNNELFLQLAEEKGIDTTVHDAEEDVKRLKKLDEDGYQELVNKFNYSDEQIGNQIRLEKVRKEYIDQFIEVDVTEDEIKELYEETAEQTEEELPDYDSAKSRLKESIEVNKSIEQVGEHIETYKKESNIEIHI